MSIKFKVNNAVGDLVFLKSSDAVEWSGFFLIH